jgi:hypothetical protein
MGRPVTRPPRFRDVLRACSPKALDVTIPGFHRRHFVPHLWDWAFRGWDTARPVLCVFVRFYYVVVTMVLFAVVVLPGFKMQSDLMASLCWLF